MLGRQKLRLIQNHHAVGDVVQLATARWSGGVKRFKELDVGSDDDGRIPVLTGNTAFGGFVFRFEIAVMLDDRRRVDAVEHAAKYVGRLLNDAGVGYDIDDSPLTITFGVMQGKTERGQRFSAAGGHREREETRW